MDNSNQSPKMLNFSKRKQFSWILKFFKIKKDESRQSRIEFYKKQSKKKFERVYIIKERKNKLKYYIKHAGFDIDPSKLSKRLFDLCILVNLVISFYLMYYFSTNLGFTWFIVISSMITLWVLIFVIILFVVWIGFYIIADIKIYKRKLDLEDVLPDFLQLTASNIKAGMTIDRALWYAVRPRFGVLAKEIEMVAKDTMGGEDLKKALEKFVNKYDSLVLKRSISLLIEGIDAGSEIGDLLNRIALNIYENKAMRKEMSANVTAYTIFITFSSVFAAPVLFGLAGVLIRVIKNLGTSLEQVGSIPQVSGIVISFSGTGISYTDFKIFAIISLILTSFFSAAIIATIKKGNIKSGFKYVPIFVVTSITLFLLADFILAKFMAFFI